MGQHGGFRFGLQVWGSWSAYNDPAQMGPTQFCTQCVQNLGVRKNLGTADHVGEVHRYSPDMGARPIERAVDEWVVQPLVDAWFANRLKGRPVRFTVAASAQSAPGASKIVFSQD